ncbi:MAG TPA: DUF664 domain-containing protein [Acidimicrobiales bacterium]|jgi:hypothetical protein|nr:DUF664 domain-containing protein [Acidimicrobiales bacterium]
MTEPNGLLTDAFERVQEAVHAVVGGLTEAQLTFRPGPEANSIAWLVWHLTRIQDDHIAEVAGTEQLWMSAGWYDRFGLPFDASATGYGHSPDEVAAVAVQTPALLSGYHDDVAAHTLSYVGGLAPSDLTRVVDDSWDPPVTLGTRLVSVLSDDLQHVGQAAYVHGLIFSGG